MKRILFLSLLVVSIIQAQEETPKNNTLSWPAWSVMVAKDLAQLTGLGLAKTTLAAINPGYYFVGATTKVLKKNAGIDLKPKGNEESADMDALKLGALSLMHGTLGAHVNLNFSAMNHIREYYTTPVAKIKNPDTIPHLGGDVTLGTIVSKYIYSTRYLKKIGGISVKFPEYWVIPVCSSSTIIDYIASHHKNNTK